jgi:hypothetical protein
MNYGFEPTLLHCEYRLCKRDALPQKKTANAKDKPLSETCRRQPLDVLHPLAPLVFRSPG